MGDILLDPTDKVEREHKAFAPRLETLAGKTVGLLDISKSKGAFFLDRVEEVVVVKTEAGNDYEHNASRFSCAVL